VSKLTVLLHLQAASENSLQRLRKVVTFREDWQFTVRINVLAEERLCISGNIRRGRRYLVDGASSG
jgi:hypothetical protein